MVARSSSLARFPPLYYDAASHECRPFSLYFFSILSKNDILKKSLSVFPYYVFIISVSVRPNRVKRCIIWLWNIFIRQNHDWTPWFRNSFLKPLKTIPCSFFRPLKGWVFIFFFSLVKPKSDIFLISVTVVLCLDRLKWNNEPLSPKSRMKPREGQKRTIFSCLIFGRGGYRFSIYVVQYCWCSGQLILALARVWVKLIILT